MKPNDENGHLPRSKRPFRILIIAGSDRRQFNCPGIDSKARTLAFRMLDRLPQDWEIDLEDLGNVYGREQIQSCNACVSTSMALCVWPCNCYEKKNRKQPDLMWNLDLYARLDLADAWAIIGPVNWWGPTSNLKLMFDRLVCMNGGNPDESLINHKDPELAMKLEHSSKWQRLSRNHMEGRTAAFFCYGDGGGDELDADGRPKALKHKEYFDPDRDGFDDDRETYAPMVWQCRYSGIEVPEQLWSYLEFGAKKKYSDNQAEDMVREERVLDVFDCWVDRFASFVRKKGKVKPGKYRAFGYDPPSHVMADLKTKWRGTRIALGMPPAGSSPNIQEELDLNRDQSIHYKRSEGEKRRR